MEVGDAKGSRHLVSGDALRAIAALGVLAYHVAIGTAIVSGAGGAGLFVDAYGTAGHVFTWRNVPLYLFFVLSGYLVGGPFARAWIAGDRGPQTRAYLRRRAARIAPAFWVVCVYLVIRNGTGGDTLSSLAALFTFAPEQVPGALVDAFPQAWTLHVEVSFYLVLAAVGALLLRAGGQPAAPAARRRALTGVLAGVTVVTIAVKQRAGFEGGLATSLLALGYAFVPGVLIAAYEPELRQEAAVRGAALVRGLLLVAAAGFLALVVFSPGGEGVRAVGYLVISGSVVTAVVVREWHAGPPRALVGGPMSALGRWSYGIYLWHVAVAVEVAWLVPGDWSAWAALALVLPLTVAGSLALAAASWRCVEAPAIRWARRPRSAAAAVPPVTAAPIDGQRI